MTALKITLTTALTLYLLLGTYLYQTQRTHLYHPTPKTHHPHTTQTLNVKDATLEIITHNTHKPNAILYFGGNGENIAKTAPHLIKLLPNHALYLHTYRGYGASTGTPTEQSNYQDAKTLYDTTSPNHKTTTLIGRSLGTAIATHLAAHRKTHKLILITPYNSIQKIAQDQYPIYPMSLLLKDKYQSIKNIKHIQAPTLILLAQYDKVTPHKYAHPLINQFPKTQLTTQTIPNANHRNLSQSPHYARHIQQFVQN